MHALGRPNIPNGYFDQKSFEAKKVLSNLFLEIKENLFSIIFLPQISLNGSIHVERHHYLCNGTMMEIYQTHLMVILTRK